MQTLARSLLASVAAPVLVARRRHAGVPVDVGDGGAEDEPPVGPVSAAAAGRRPVRGDRGVVVHREQLVGRGHVGLDEKGDVGALAVDRLHCYVALLSCGNC